MEQITIIKAGILTALGTIGGVIASAFGGWTSGMTTLLCFL